VKFDGENMIDKLSSLPLPPFAELMAPEEFTNRTRELEFLWNLADRAKRRIASSYVLIARKGMGKTALMLEFYRQLFTQQKQVVPFFVSFAEFKDKPERVQLSLGQFASHLFVNAAMQYSAFKSGKFLAPPDLPTLPAEQREFFAASGDDYLEKQFHGHVDAIATGAVDAAFHHAVEFAATITSMRGEAGLLMIDEFQVLTEVYHERLGKFVDITDGFQKAAEARWCPMLVSGSAVSLVVETTMGGLLARRFGPYYLDPFDERHALEFAYKLSRREGVALSEAAASEIYRLTGGNPYYLVCFFESLGLENDGLATLEAVEKVYTFETTNRHGKIRKFWDEHFTAFADKINDDKIGLKCLYQLAVAKKEVRVEEVAAELGAPPEQVRRVMKNLDRADLVERQAGSLFPVYHHITDPVLAAYIEREYQMGLVGQSLDDFLHAQFEKLKQQRGRAARLLGEAAELYARHVLMSFDGEEVDAAEIFDLPLGKFKLPRFKKVEHRTGLVIEGEMIEFDLLAEGEETWLVEVRYRKEPVRIDDVEKFVEKISKLEDWQQPLAPGKRLWFFSRSGFDEQASQRLRELGVLHSSIAGFNALCRGVKIGEVPV
jgi:AAA+ ATPase superfamily predicted ATPase